MTDKKNTGSGYLGDLSPDQEKQFAAFKASARPAGAKEDVTNDDYQLLRFLRARKFDLKQAEEMRNKHLEWRKKWDVENLAKNRPPKYDLYEKMLTHQHHGNDLNGRPVIYEKLGKAKPATMQALFKPDEYLRCHIHKMLVLIGRVEEASKKYGRHIETFTMVLDLNGVTFSNNNDFLILASENDNWNFPERLGRIIVINTPWVFPFFWKIASPFIDAKTKAKIAVSYGNPTADLTKDIAIEGLASEYGGKCVCKGAGKPCVPEFDVSDLKLSDITGQQSEETVTTIAAGKKHEVVLDGKAKGSTLHWYFRGKDDCDIKFHVHMLPSDAKTGTAPTLVKSTGKITTDQGSHTVETGCKWTVCFDNGYSWMSSKTVQWSVMIVQNGEMPVISTSDDGKTVPASPPAAGSGSGSAAAGSAPAPSAPAK